MNRRHFLKTAGLGGICVVVPAGPLRASRAASDSPVLAEADARIRKHRRGTVALKLIGPDARPLPAGLTVRITQTRHKFLFGCNIFKLEKCRTPEDNAAYARRFAELLNFATLPFYWWNYERQRGRPDDARTEQIVRWCRANGVTAKGHPLAWNWAEPPWLPDDPQVAMQLQLKRIERCVRRFRGDINIWDVVNEATHYDRDRAKKYAPKLTAAIESMGVGEYVRSAFAAARRANPDATLLINDYRTDADYQKKVISQLIANGKPMYDVIGIQSHMHGGFWGAQRAWDVCERFAKHGVPLHFTETTVVSGPRSNKGWVTTAEGERRQARHVVEFYTTLFSHPAVEAITWWDFTDQNAWQGAPAGLVRSDMSPKPAYDRLKDLIKGKWWTQTQAVTAPGGKASFTGFLGRYRLAATVNGRRLAGSFELDKGTTGPIEIKLA